MAVDIFKLVGSIFVDTSDADSSISKTDENAQSLGTTFLNGITTVAKWGAAVGTAAVAACAAITTFAVDTASAGDTIDKMSQKLGVSREAYQELDYICSQSGMSVDSLETGMKTLTSAMDGVLSGTESNIEQFEKLGVSVLDNEGNLRDQEDVLWETLEALQGMENQTEKAALATDLFGSAGTDLIPLINGATGSIETMKEQAHELGLIMSDEFVDNSVALTDTVDQIKRSFTAVVSTLASSFIPVVQQAGEKIIEYIPTIQAWASDVSDFFAQIPTKIQEFKDKLTSISNWMTEHETLFTLFAIAIGTITTAIIAYNIAVNAKNILSAIETAQIYALIVAENLHTTATTIATTVTTAFGTAVAFLTSPITLVIVAIGALIAIIYLLVTNWDTVKETAISVWNTIKETFSNASSWFNTNVVIPIKTAFNEVLSNVKTVFDDVKTAIMSPIETAQEFIKSAIEKIKSYFDFTWSLPTLKLPHFSVSGSFSLNPLSVPSFGIEWYKDGGILTDPTMFGFNPFTQNAMIGGEAGPEAIAPISDLTNYVKIAVQEENAQLMKYLEKILALLEIYFPKIYEGLAKEIYLDTGVLVGSIAKDIDSALGIIEKYKARGI